MVWAIEWSDQAVVDLNKVDQGLARRIVQKLERAAEDPPRFFVRLVGSEDYKLRVGDYRLVALLSHETRTILVERVDHRSRVYRRR